MSTVWLRYLTKLGSRQPPISKKRFLAYRVLCSYEDFEGNYATKKNSFCPKELCSSFRSLLCKTRLNPLVQLLISKFINTKNQMIRLVGSKRTWRYYGTIMAYQVSTHSWCKSKSYRTIKGRFSIKGNDMIIHLERRNQVPY